MADMKSELRYLLEHENDEENITRERVHAREQVIIQTDYKF